jgi:hypothetical protein
MDKKAVEIAIEWSHTLKYYGTGYVMGFLPEGEVESVFDGCMAISDDPTFCDFHLWARGLAEDIVDYYYMDHYRKLRCENSLDGNGIILMDVSSRGWEQERGSPF